MSKRNEVLDNRLARYSAVLGAAAVSGIAVTDAAEAVIIHTGNANINIYQYGALTLDVNLDGYTDINLQNYVFGGNYQGASVASFPGQLHSFTTGLTYGTALSPGDPIDAGTVGPSFFGGLAYANNPDSQFDNITDGLIGFSFPIGAGLHFAWVSVDIDNAAGTFVVNEWAYESDPGVGIAAAAIPEPSALGLLAAGAAGLSVMRRNRKAG
ncbi:MAG: PEP-CTERM sorting domain-containing protein [Planctomycetota bacterium]